jgi:hypothetical protein
MPEAATDAASATDADAATGEHGNSAGLTVLRWGALALRSACAHAAPSAGGADAATSAAA